MFDEKGMKETNPHIKEFKLVSDDKNGTKVVYSSSKMPMMTERDNLMKMVKKTLPNGDQTVVISSIEHPDYPERKGIIRMEMFKASLVKQVDKDISITEFSNFNMKGYFPMRLLNMVMASAVSKGLDGIHQKILKC